MAAWMEVSIITSQEAVEAVSEMLVDKGAGGVRIEDRSLANQVCLTPDEILPDNVVPSGDEDASATIKGYFPDRPGFERTIEGIRSWVARIGQWNLDPGPGRVRVERVDEEDWATAWKAHFHVEHVGRTLVVKPSWEPYEPRPQERVIELDPGQAFGTGTHPTTRLCLQLLEAKIGPGMRVADIGTGSGILSIGATLLDAGFVAACDISDVAVDTARENLRRNGFSSSAVVHGAAPALRNWAPFDVVVSNIIADVIVDIRSDVKTLLTGGGTWIASGIIDQREDDVADSLRSAGFQIQEVHHEGEWVAVAAVTPQ